MVVNSHPLYQLSYAGKSPLRRPKTLPDLDEGVKLFGASAPAWIYPLRSAGSVSHCLAFGGLQRALHSLSDVMGSVPHLLEAPGHALSRRA